MTASALREILDSEAEAVIAAYCDAMREMHGVNAVECRVALRRMILRQTREQSS